MLTIVQIYLKFPHSNLNCTQSPYDPSKIYSSNVEPEVATAPKNPTLAPAGKSARIPLPSAKMSHTTQPHRFRNAWSTFIDANSVPSSIVTPEGDRRRSKGRPSDAARCVIRHPWTVSFPWLFRTSRWNYPLLGCRFRHAKCRMCIGLFGSCSTGPVSIFFQNLSVC